MTTARELALDVLSSDRPGGAFVGERLDDAISRALLSPADRRLATELVYGILRRRGTLDALLAPFLQRPPSPELLHILHLGAYQLVFLDHVPVHAAVNETVALVRNGNPRWVGFVNGVLRNLDRALTTNFGTTPSADAVPLVDGRHRKLDRPIFADPRNKPSQYLAAAFHLPEWLMGRWLRRLKWDESLRQAQWFSGPPQTWLRVNRLRCDRDKMLAALKEAGFEAEPGDLPMSIRLLGPAPIRSLPGYDDGWFSVQDITAQRAAELLAPHPGCRILDRCSAPGGKTTHLAELMNDKGEVVACDADARRLDTVAKLGQRLGLKSIVPMLTPRGTAPPRGVFDAALVDVPCSNTGVFHRRPEVRTRLTPNDLAELTVIQRQLLNECLDRVRPGGFIVYSTCSLEPEENGEMVRSVLQRRNGFVIESEIEARPGQPGDGGYLARIRKENAP